MPLLWKSWLTVSSTKEFKLNMLCVGIIFMKYKFHAQKIRPLELLNNISMRNEVQAKFPSRTESESVSSFMTRLIKHGLTDP